MRAAKCNALDRSMSTSARNVASTPAAQTRTVRLPVRTLPQPDETTCGPTCLHAVYAYWGDTEPLSEVVARMWRMPDGGTFAVFLACDALRKGYRASIYTYNLNVFDPSWFSGPAADLALKLDRQREVKHHKPISDVTQEYMEFLRLGGRLRLTDLSGHLVAAILRRRLPILTGLSSTYLYRSARERADGTPDDIAGLPSGHFVVIAGWSSRRRRVLVVDPYEPNPYGQPHEYWISIDRVIAAILLGIVTHDANMLVVYPPRQTEGRGQ
jgi:hypothetical protein